VSFAIKYIFSFHFLPFLLQNSDSRERIKFIKSENKQREHIEIGEIVFIVVAAERKYRSFRKLEHQTQDEHDSFLYAFKHDSN